LKRFIQGEDRNQATLLPELLDGYVADTNHVRVVDVFVDELDLGKLGFEGLIRPQLADPRITPPYCLRYTSTVT
jgi:transposase